MDSKVCTHCGKEQSLEQFAKRHGRDGRQSWCRSCTLEWQRGRYHGSYKTDPRNRQRYLRRKALKAGRKERAVAYKGGACARCGYDRYVGALDFHHLDPSRKDWKLGSRLPNGSWESIIEELDKCVLLCANCHRELHHELATEGDSGVTVGSDL